MSPSPRLADGLVLTSPVFPRSAAIGYHSSRPHQRLPREFGEDVPTHPSLSTNCPSPSSGTGRLGLSSHFKNPVRAGSESLRENRQVCYGESRSHFSTPNILFAPFPPACPFLPPSQAGREAPCCWAFLPPSDQMFHLLLLLQDTPVKSWQHTAHPELCC